MRKKKGKLSIDRKLEKTDAEILKDETELWEKQPRESDKAFSIFNFYRDMPNRKLHDGRIKREFNIAQSTVNYYSHVYAWKERVRAWDNYLDKRKQAAQIKAIEEMAERHAKQAMAVETSLMVPVKEFLDKIRNIGAGEMKNMKVKDLYKLVVDAAEKLPRIIEIERKARGADVNKNSLDITSDGEPIKPVISITVQGSKSPLLEKLSNVGNANVKES